MSSNPEREAQGNGGEDWSRRYRALLAAICSDLGSSPADADHIMSEGCLRLDGVDFAVRLDEAARQVEFYGDCGRVAPAQAQQVYEHVLEQALSNDVPALVIGLHAESRHLVARCSFHLPSVDSEGWLCVAALMLAVARIKALRERFSLEPMHPVGAEA